MSVAEVVSFAQAVFATDGSGAIPEHRPPLPPWVPTSPQAPRSIEPDSDAPTVLPLDEDDDLLISAKPDLIEAPPETSAGKWGTDVLAYYLPFHFFRQAWGIYIRAWGLAYLAQLVKGLRLLLGDDQFLETARTVVHRKLCSVYNRQFAYPRLSTN